MTFLNALETIFNAYPNNYKDSMRKWQETAKFKESEVCNGSTEDNLLRTMRKTV